MHEKKVIKQYEPDIDEGLMAKTTLGQAIDRYGKDQIIAGTGAIAQIAGPRRAPAKRLPRVWTSQGLRPKAT